MCALLCARLDIKLCQKLLRNPFAGPRSSRNRTAPPLAENPKRNGSATKPGGARTATTLVPR
jgi:hypothetical protein